MKGRKGFKELKPYNMMANRFSSSKTQSKQVRVPLSELLLDRVLDEVSLIRDKIKQKPDYYPLYRNLLKKYLDLRANNKNLMDTLDKIVKTFYKNMDAIMLTLQLLRRYNRYDLAVRFIDDVLKRRKRMNITHPRFDRELRLSSYMCKGGLALFNNDIKQSLRFFERGLEYADRHGFRISLGDRLLIGVAYARNQDYDRAKEFLGPLVKRTIPTIPNLREIVLSNLMYAAFMSGEKKDAKQYASEVKQMYLSETKGSNSDEPVFPALPYRLAVRVLVLLYLEHGMYDEAVKCARRLYMYEEDDPHLFKLWLNAYSQWINDRFHRIKERPNKTRVNLLWTDVHQQNEVFRYLMTQHPDWWDNNDLNRSLHTLKRLVEDIKKYKNSLDKEKSAGYVFEDLHMNRDLS